MELNLLEPTNDCWQTLHESSGQYHHSWTSQSLSIDQTCNIISWQTLFTCLWRWLSLTLSKRQSPTTVLFRTTLTRTITQDDLLILMDSNHTLWNQIFFNKALALNNKLIHVLQSPTTLCTRTYVSHWIRTRVSRFCFVLSYLVFLVLSFSSGWYTLLSMLPAADRSVKHFDGQLNYIPFYYRLAWLCIMLGLTNLVPRTRSLWCYPCCGR